MAEPSDNFKINLNQNLWGLVVGFASLGAAEYYHLGTLFWFASITSTVLALSVVVTTFAYTIRYCKGKLA